MKCSLVLLLGTLAWCASEEEEEEDRHWARLFLGSLAGFLGGGDQGRLIFLALANGSTDELSYCPKFFPALSRIRLIGFW